MTVAAETNPERPPIQNGSRPGPDSPEARSIRELAATHPILFFDGVCGLCNATVDFVAARDRRGLFRFAPLQGQTAAAVLEAGDIEGLKSLVLYDERGAHRRSRAVWRMLRRLGGIWALAGMLLWVVPWPVRDVGYRLVSRSRYRLFGKKETCRLPSPEERARFLA